MQKTVKVKYIGWGDTFDYKNYLIQRILEKYFNVIISDEPDYVFCTPFSMEYLKYDCIRIFYTAENVTPDFNTFDYAIGFDEISFGDRYIRVPNFITHPKYLKDLQLLSERHKITDFEENRGFCGYVCSNGAADPMRDFVYDEISKYKKVDSGGKYRNNINLPTGVENKLEFQKKYKFALALENTSFKGYTTEKLVEAFAAGGIPIYWGDPEVNKYFNEKAFINVSNYSTIDEAVEKIKEVDNNTELYMEYMNAPAFVDLEYPEKIRREFEAFLVNIFDQPIERAYRRNRGSWGEKVTNIIIEGSKPKKVENTNLLKQCKNYISNKFSSSKFFK